MDMFAAPEGAVEGVGCGGVVVFAGCCGLQSGIVRARLVVVGHV